VRELGLDGLAAGLGQLVRVVLVQRDGVFLLLEAVLPDPLRRFRQRFFVELLEAGLFLVGAFEGGDAGVGCREGRLELGDGGLGGGFFDFCEKAGGRG
jgi:hypothetical protein